MFAYQGPIKFEQMLVHRAEVREEDVEELEWHQTQAAVGVKEEGGMPASNVDNQVTMPMPVHKVHKDV
jgi:hypothetical protein